MSTNEMSAAMERAVEMLQSGDAIEAENIMRRAVDETIAKTGESSVQAAHAHWELGSVMTGLQRLPEAADAMRKAVAINVPDDHQATRDRLTYIMSLGQLLHQLDELDEAEQVLREGLELRESFYERDHPGYGFGLEPLAEVVLSQGQPEAALAMIEEVIDIFWAAGHPRVATAFPLRGEILKRLDCDDPPFEGIEELPEPILCEMAEAAWNRVDAADPAISAAVIRDLLDVVAPRLGDDHDTVISLNSAFANLNAEVGGAEGRIEALEKVIASYESRGEFANAGAARLGLALALSDGGDIDGAVQTYHRIAEEFGPQADSPEPSLRAAALRNLGLLLSDEQRNGEAEQAMRDALDAAPHDSEQLSKTSIALGIFLQHEGRLNEALPFLESGVAQADPAAPDSICARSHLEALRENRSCSCGDMGAAVETAFRQFVLERLPDGLIKDLSVELGEDGWKIQIDAEELAEEERELLGRTIRQAQVEFQSRLKRGE